MGMGTPESRGIVNEQTVSVLAWVLSIPLLVLYQLWFGSNMYRMGKRHAYRRGQAAAELRASRIYDKKLREFTAQFETDAVAKRVLDIWYEMGRMSLDNADRKERPS